MFALLSTLDCSKASRADDISARMLKMTAFSIAAPIAQIFNTSISLGDLPHEWKTARVIPIPKGAASSDPSKYRPISLLSVLSKLLETFIRGILLDHLIGSLLSAICNGVSLAASLLLELSLLPLITGISYWILEVKFVLCFLTIARLLILCLIGLFSISFGPSIYPKMVSLLSVQ